MYWLDELTMVKLEKLVSVEVEEATITLSFDNGKEISRSCVSYDEARSKQLTLRDAIETKKKVANLT